MKTGDVIKKLREANGISQLALCHIIGVEQSTLANYENNRRSPKNETLVALAEFFNVSTDRLLGVDFESEELATARKTVLKLSAHMSAETIEAGLGVDFATFNGWRHGYGDYFNNRLGVLSDFFGTTSDFLLGRTKNPGNVTDEHVKFALFGEWVSDEKLAEVKRFAGYINCCE